ncbi:unnamed protein product [Rotaria sordida]|uniref:Uncharacterized protein n=1 Tax=Rotaria sordida TaxID=392033 RepID=A0A819NW39_9BILA|nr:unnamed protein product [Rotaria sordida]CAF4004059.1 unnamed protein product [Rotaria sordida]
MWPKRNRIFEHEQFESYQFDFNVYEADEIDNEIETDVEVISLHDDLQQQNLTPDQLHHLFSQVSSKLVAESLDDQEFFKREVTIKPPKASTVMQTPFPPPLSDRKEDFNINVEELKQLVKAEASPLIIERYSPDKEEIDHVLSTIALTFNQPMIAIASLDEQMNPEGLGISLTPKIEGKLEDEFLFEFSTKTLKVLQFLPHGTVSTLKPKCFLLFNQKININEIFQHICVVRDDEHTIQTDELELLDEEIAKTEFESLMNENEGNRQQYIAFTFKNVLLKATQYIIQIPEDCPSAEGPLKTKSEWSANFHTYEPLKIIDCLPNINNKYQKTAVPGENWSLTFNNSLDHSTIKKSIFKFEPEVAILSIEQREYDDREIIIRNNSQPNTVYSLFIQPGILKDIHGQALEQDHFDQPIQFHVNDSNSRLLGALSGESGYVRLLKQEGEAKVPTYSQGVINYTIYDSQHQQLQQSKVELNKYGAFDVIFTLPDNVNLGDGYVKFSLSNSENSTKHYFNVQEFRKPEYQVSSMIQPTIAHFCHPTVDEYVIATCQGKLFSGGYLSYANVKWTVQAKTTTFIPAKRSDYIFGRGKSFFSWSGDDDETNISYPKKHLQVI